MFIAETNLSYNEVYLRVDKDNLEVGIYLSNKEVAGARGFNLCAYLVALEGWRRGLKLKWYYNLSTVSDLKIIGFNPIGKAFSLTSNNKTHYFYRSRGDKVANEAVTICSNKETTKEILSQSNIPVPVGKEFESDTIDEKIVGYAEEIGYPVVLKPSEGSLGKGVYTNLGSADELKTALQYLRSDYDYSSYIIEQHIVGQEHRVYVVGNKVVGAINRIPANVIGDGEHTIEELINIKNEARKKNPHLSTRLIKVNQEMLQILKKEGYTLQCVPAKGEQVFLSKKSNISSGGDSIESTDSLSEEIKEVAIDTVRSIPGMLHAGIDLIVDPINEHKGTVIEVNATAGIGLHLFPSVGSSRDVPGAIIDYYFPETISETPKNKMLFFDYKIVNELLSSKAVNEIEIFSAPRGQVYAKKFIVSGNVQGVGYRQWIRGRAVKLNIDGYTKNLKNGKVVVVAVSDNMEVLEEFRQLCHMGPERSKVEKVTEHEWTSSVKVGFEIRRPSPKETINELKSEIKSTKKKLKALKKENTVLVEKVKYINQEYNKLKNSSSWKITAPLRKVKNILR